MQRRTAVILAEPDAAGDGRRGRAPLSSAPGRIFPARCYRRPMRLLSALALIALGCSPSAPSDSVDAGTDAPDVARAADVRDAASDARDPCRPPFGSGRPEMITCDGACVAVNEANCGACGRACADGQTCCIGGAMTRCLFNCSQP